MPSTVSRENFRTRGKKGYVQEFPEAATQSFVTNDFLKVHTDGTVLLPVTSGNTVDSGEVGQGLVRALEPATGVTGSMISCEIIPQGQEFLGIVVNGTSQIDSVQTQIGDLLTLRYIASGSPAGVTTLMWGADSNDSTNGIVKLSQFDRTEVIGITCNYHLCWMHLIDLARFQN